MDASENSWSRFLTSGRRFLLILFLDGAIAAASLWLAFQLRFDHPEDFDQGFWSLASALIIGRVLANLYFRLHRWSFKLSNLTDGARVVLAGVAGSVLFVGLTYFFLRPHFSLEMPARGVVVLELLMSTAAMAALRFAPRLAWMYRADLLRGRREGTLRTLIVGAGATGEGLLRQFQSREDHDYHVIGFVDDDPVKWGHIIGGRPILGSVSSLPRQVLDLRVDMVVIAVPSLSASRLREILSLGFAKKVHFRILPTTYGKPQERDVAAALRDLSTRDLLERPVQTFEWLQPAPFKPSRVQLVAGAAGSIGREVCSQLLELGSRRLVMIDTDENELYVLKRRFDRLFADREIVAEVADIRDRARLDYLFSIYRPVDVFHAAARKHVPLMESAPGEAVKTNVFGTLNLAEAAMAFGVERFLFTSTDKAVRPTSVMGASKRLGEQLLRHLAHGAPTSFVIVRFGNVLDSAGSVVPLFREQIAAGGPVTVTHPQIQRYFMTIAEAVGLVLRATYGGQGPLCVLEMGEPIRILDLARLMITMAGLVPDIDIKIEFTGLRPGEKLFEELLAEGERVRDHIDQKIKIVESPPPPTQVRGRLEDLRVAAAAEDQLRVVALLHELVPDFRSLPLRPALSSTMVHETPAVVM